MELTKEALVCDEFIDHMFAKFDQDLSSKYHEFFPTDEGKKAFAAGLIMKNINIKWPVENKENIAAYLESLESFPIAVRKVMEALDGQQ